MLFHICLVYNLISLLDMSEQKLCVLFLFPLFGGSTCTAHLVSLILIKLMLPNELYNV